MHILETLIMYGYNDMSIYLIQLISNKDKYNYLPLIEESNTQFNPDYINSLINSLVFNHFSFILSVNLLFIIYFLLNISITYLLFRKLSRNNIFSFIFSILYATSIYFIFRGISFTTNLYQIFIFPIVILILLNRKINAYLLGIIIFIMFSISLYYGYFSILLVLLWFFVDFIFDQDIFQKKMLYLLVKSSKVIFILGICLTIFFLPLVQKNYVNHTIYMDSEKLIVNTKYRPIEDFYNFTFRPWYFIIPPKSSVFFGTLSEQIYKNIAFTNYYLADDYTEREAGGSYLGWHFLLGVLFTIYILYFNKITKLKKLFYNVQANRGLITRCLMIIFLILLITEPPSFSMLGITFYTPSYLLYYFASAFRVLVRFSIVIYLFILIINYFLILDLYKIFKTKSLKLIFIVFFCVLNYLIFSVNIPLIDISNPPSEIRALAGFSKSPFEYSVYPNGDYYSIFWISYHRKSLMNPVGLNNSNLKFNSDSFSNNLLSEEGMDDAKKLGMDYLVFYKNRVASDEIEKINDFFKSELLTIVFENNYCIIYRV